MQHLQTSFFYDLQELIRTAPLIRKYYCIFKALYLSALQDRNYSPGRTGHSHHAILRAFIIKHLECIKSVPQLIEYLNSIPPLLEMCGFELGNLPDESQFYRFIEKTRKSTLKAVHQKANELLIIVEQMKSTAYIPINPRNQKDDKTFGPHGCPLCDAGLEMKSAGRWTEGNRERIKFRCPLKMSKKLAAKFDNACPAEHPLFGTGKCYGCTKYLDVTDDARSRVPRDSKEFKKIFKHRQTVEQYFSRLGDREVEQTTHYSFTAISNQMTIAHLTASLIAIAAAILLKQPDKIRCYRTFAHPPTQSRAG